MCLLQVERWLDAVQELLSRDATGLGTESLQEELNQCKVRGQNKKLKHRFLFCPTYVDTFVAKTT